MQIEEMNFLTRSDYFASMVTELMFNPYDTLSSLFSQLFSCELRKLLKMDGFLFAKMGFSCILNSGLCECLIIVVTRTPVAGAEGSTQTEPTFR